MICTLFIKIIIAQNVGLGTTTPHASALLELKSTTMGLLVPRMGNFQRLAIPSPANGLLVYDTVYNEFYHYNGSIWRAMLNSNYWLRPAASRDRIGNTSDSVGIGNASPAHRLDVSGNIRSRQDVLADGKIVAQGILSGSSVTTPGNLAVAGIGYIVGDITTNSGLTINNASGTLTFNASGADKAFVQLSGNNLRVGTFSGNTAGKFIVRLGGADRITVENEGNMGIGVSNPGSLLDVGGNINLSGKMTRTNNGSANMLPVAYGFIRSNATIASGSGNFTVSRPQDGVFIITCSDFNSNTVVVATTSAIGLTIGASRSSISNQIEVIIRDIDGEYINAFFNFVAFTP